MELSGGDIIPAIKKRDGRHTSLCNRNHSQSIIKIGVSVDLVVIAMGRRVLLKVSSVLR